MTDPVPVAVVGAGNMGSNHIRVYDELPGAELVEVVEPDPELAATVREEYDVEVYASVKELSVAVAATVAVPNEQHRTVAEQCLSSGLDVLVEKPLATSVEDASAIVRAADESGAILMVGHIERYNPGVQTLRELLAEQQVFAVEAHRLGPFNDHLSKESVIMDLMIHDLDIVEWLVDDTVDRLDAIGTTARSETLDHAVVQLKFENEVLGTVTASHITHAKIRKLALMTEETYITLDYQRQTIDIQRVGSESTLSTGNSGDYRTETVTESLHVNTREPLKNELEHFLTCVRTRESPLTDGEVGVRSIQRAIQTLERI